MRKLLLLALTLVAVVVTIVSTAVAQSPSRQRFAGTFTAQASGSPTGYRLAIDYRNPADPDGKPFAVAKILQRLHPGTRIDTSVPERCRATDAELIARGESACPRGSRVGGGELDADTGMAAGPAPRVIENRVVFFNAERELILFTESTNTSGPRLRTSGRVAVGRGTFTSRVPPVPAAPPPDPFLAIKRVRVTLVAVTTGSGPDRRSFITTPERCPPGGSWTNSATFTYRDGVTQTERSASACRGGGARSGGASRSGTARDDVLVGTRGDDVILCGAGDDRVDGRGGDDVIHCGSGDDVVNGGSGDDQVRGGSGDDDLYGGSGDDALAGESGDDRLVGGPGRDRIREGTGRDSTSR